MLAFGKHQVNRRSQNRSIDPRGKGKRKGI